MKTIIEPFKIKSVEPIRMTTAAERDAILKSARYNLFGIASEDVLIDLLTDSGTGAMSAEQWAGIQRGDESYAGSPSFRRFEQAVGDLTGMPHVLPTHQGRAAEKILFGLIGGAGKMIPNNTHFDTTRAHIEYTGTEARDFVIAEGKIPALLHPFKGNIDVPALKAAIEKFGPEKVPCCVLTVTNNSSGGQPVSMANIKELKAALVPFGIPLILDCCRFAENAWFIKEREAGFENRTVKSIAQEMFSYADGATMSAKKDGLANMGGFLSLRDGELAEKAKQMLILTEGFPTYGGLSGRDLEAVARGLVEVVDEDYLRYRIASVAYLGNAISKGGVPIILPPGGHAIYIDAESMLSHIPKSEYPGQALSCALYKHAGVRSCEIGSVMFGKRLDDGSETYSTNELVRLAIPRRVYTQSHVDYLVEAILELNEAKSAICGYRIVEQSKFLRHFTAAFEPLPAKN